MYTKHTPLSFASWCMLHIHNSASLRGVCADTPLSFASLVYLLHIHNSAAPRLCIFPYTILSSDVRHYYTTPVVYFAVGDEVISNGLKSPIYRPQGHHSIYGGFQPVGDHFISNGKIHNSRCIILFSNCLLQGYASIHNSASLRCVCCTIHNSALLRGVWADTQLSFASWCICPYTTQLCFVVYGQIHNSASLRGVSDAYTTQLRFVVYLSSVRYTTRLRLVVYRLVLCIFASPTVGRTLYYTTPIV